MSILTAALIVLIQVASGSLLILLIPDSRIRSKFEVVGLGLALGTFISMLSSVLFVNTALNSVAWALPTVVIVIAALVRLNFVRARMRQITLPRNESIAIVVGLLIGFALLAINWIRVPLSTIRAGGSVDMYFFEALARGISEFGASESILMSGGSLRYHWFSYGWAGELGQLANTDSFVALTRILPVVALIGVVLLAAAWAGSIRIGKTQSPWWVPSLAVILIVFSGYTGALYGIVLNFDSPSQAFTTVWLLALVMVFLRGLRSTTRSELFFYSVLVVFMAGATTGGKASHVAVALGGFGLIIAFAVVLRPLWWRRALVLFTAAIVGAVLVYVWVLSGVGLEANLADSIAVRASTWQGLDPVAGKWGPLLGTFALLLAVIPRVIGVSWLAVNRTGRTSPEFHFALGSLAVGVLALFVLRGGINELWFLLAASAPLAVISSYGIGQAQSWMHPRIQRALICTVVIAVAASLLSLVLSMNWEFDDQPSEFFLWPGILYWLSVTGLWILIVVSSLLAVRYFLPQTGSGERPGFFTAVFAMSISALVLTSVFTRPAVLWTESRPLTTDIGVVTPTTESGVTSPTTNTGGNLFIDLVSAADWITANTDRSDQIATNAPVSSFVPAFTGNQMYLAGSRYQAGLGDASQLSEVDRRGEVSASMSMAVLNGFSDERALQELCETGVAYLWIEGPVNPSESQPVYSNESVSIYSLNKQCGEVSTN
jgi:hypothetical protein